VRIRTLAAAGIVAVLASACGSSGAKAPSSSQSSTGTSATGCAQPPSAHPKQQQFKAEPPLSIAKATYTATIVTNCGTIVAALDGAKAPHTVNSFAFLAGKHFFDNTICHRLTTQGIHVLQCGDPTGTGGGGPGYTIPDENLAGATYPAGTLAMANTGEPHSGGSQWFFVYGDTPLPPQYTPFGKVTSGLDLLQKVAAAGDDASNGAGDGHPNQPVTITSFTVTKAS
jgi:peptidyl-prolyl cis-trans isomerase B (cyclophilin B)